jgi:hypothetical protein
MKSFVSRRLSVLYYLSKAAAFAPHHHKNPLTIAIAKLSDDHIETNSEVAIFGRG